MKYYIIFIVLLCQISLVGQILIDSSIIEEYNVLRNNTNKLTIEKLEYLESNSPIPGLGATFVSKLIVDTLNFSELTIPSYIEFGEMELPILLSSARANKDTVKIEIFELLFSNRNVRINIVKNSFSLSYTETYEDDVLKESLIQKDKRQLTIPIVDSNLYLSKEKFSVGDEIYGAVQFKTIPYYFHAMHIKPHLKLAKSYKIYFKCRIVQDWN